MNRDSFKFLLGVAVGAFGGAILAQKALSKRDMPNAKIWQQILSAEHNHVTAATLLARVQQRYAELLDQGVTFESGALQGHLRENILPGLALYQTLRADGLDQEGALAQVDRVYTAQYQPDGTNLQRLTFIFKLLPGRFETFKWLVQNAMQRGFPSPGFELEYIPETDQNFGFDIQRCFYLDMLTHYGAPELTPSFCKIDDFTMSALPQEIQFRRTGTLGLGATHCDFRWDYVSLDEVA